VAEPALQRTDNSKTDETTWLPMPAERAYVPDMAQLMTAEELLYTNVQNKRTELVRGRLVVHEPPGGRHGYVAANLAFRLSQHSDLSGAGARLVWVIDPDRRLARVYREDGTEHVLAETDQLLGEDVLPGFSCLVASIVG
jgi:Uma2 family endonuclease